MSEDEWFTRDWPGSMFTALEHAPIRADVNRFRRFGCAVCLRLDGLLTGLLREAIELVESVASGAVTDRRLRPCARSLQELFDNGAFAGARHYAAQAGLRLLADDAGGAMGFAMSAAATDGNSLNADCAGLLRCLFGNPFRLTRTELPNEWRTETVVSLARQMYESRDFGAMPVLGDALQDAGCDDENVLNHCRDERTRGDARTSGTTQAIHARGCWVVGLVLGKE